MRPRFEVGKLLRDHKKSIEQANITSWKKRILFTLSRCRTPAMGGHIDRCKDPTCSKLHLSYNSCRNRHCPKCQGHQRELWIQKREQELLNIGYYHVVFTVPDSLNALALSDPKLVYSTLFSAAWESMVGFAANPDYLGARPGMIAILHTWGSNMSLHPHLHCIVPSGGITANSKWKSAVKGEDFLFPVKEMSVVFRAKFVAKLRKAGIKDQLLFDALFAKKWVVFTKKPFKNVCTVVEYLGRYTHKIAISNHRILSVKDKEVVFSVKNYKKEGKKENLTLPIAEFIRRFALHILPKGFVRIRHYGFLSSTGKRLYLKALQAQLGATITHKKRLPIQHLLCPSCKKGRLATVCTFKERGPPQYWLKQLEKQQTGSQKK